MSSINTPATTTLKDSDTVKTSANISHVLDTRNPVATFEGGKLYMAGNLKVLELHGSYRSMGRQYGVLMKKDLSEIYDIISADFGKKPGVNYDGLLKVGRSIYKSCPQRYKEILSGIAETSGLGLDKELIIDSIEYSYLLSKDKCSAIAAWGNYASGGLLVFGRNYDYSPTLARYASVVVYNPDDGSIPVASVTFTGCIYVTTGMNEKGLFLELNTGGPSLILAYSNKVSAPVTLFSFMEDSQDLDQLDMRFHTSHPHCAYIINVADQKEACSYEWAPFDVRRRGPDRDGLLVATNHYLDPSWGIQMLGDTFLGGETIDLGNTKKRRENLLALGEKYKGKFTPETMMKIVSIPLEKGGAFIAQQDASRQMVATCYQIVAVPKDRKIWVRIPEHQDWVEIDLKPLFS
jgi:hypothetical protein